MMKYIKTFENINDEVKVGDWIVFNEESSSYKSYRKYSYKPCEVILIGKKNSFDDGFIKVKINNDNFFILKSSIEYFANNKEDVEYYISTKKYNL